LLPDPAHVIWAHHDITASSGIRRPAHQAVMDAIAALSQDEADILTDLASHSATSICAKLEQFAAEQLPGGRNTTTEVTMRCGPACMTTFPDIPSSNNISEGILGMTKAAHRKTPNADARSASGEDDMATKSCCINHSHHDPA
jgi:hypothetical protein